MFHLRNGRQFRQSGCKQLMVRRKASRKPKYWRMPLTYDPTSLTSNPGSKHKFEG